MALLFVSCSNEVLKPPVANSVKVIDNYHGYQVEDLYRNLEDLKDSTVIDWFKSQGDFAFNRLKKIPKRQHLIDMQDRFDKIASYQISNISSTSNGFYFYIKSNAEENIGKLYYRSSINIEEKLLYDPSEYQKTLEEKYIINYIQPDWKGEKIAVSLSKQGEEISEIIIIDVLTKEVLQRIVKNANPSYGGIQWLPDNSGFIYVHFPITDPKDSQYSIQLKSVLFRLDGDPKNLEEVFSKNNNPKLQLKDEDFPFVHINTDYDEYVFGEVGGSSSFKRMYFKETKHLLSETKKWELLYRKSDMIKKVVLDGEDLIFLSAKNASNYRICKTSIVNPNFENPKILVSENSNEVITNFEVTKDGIFFVRVKNGVEAKLYSSINGLEEEIKIPNPSGKIQISAVNSVSQKLLVSNLGWIKGNTSYVYNTLKNTFTNFNLKLSDIDEDFENLIVKEIEVNSHDGTKVPLSIIYKKGIQKNGKNPTLFYGYGAYGTSAGPFFSTGFLSWVAEGGILVIAHVRGGGEKGNAWHKAGFKMTKPNTWKDMIACTEYMIKEGYTKPEKSAIWGTSAGGIMAGRAMTERPDLYAAVILVSPSVNMVRGEFQGNGPNSIKEFGTIKNHEEFKALLEMDSYHHIKEGIKYPSTLVTAGLNDGRVAPWIPAKFVAKLQAFNRSNNPMLFAVDFESGHGGMNNGALKLYEQYANALSFAFWQTGHPGYQPE
ncbi:prolyl oligopeptidase family serine peptidase [Aquimarina aggregata]|nr:prolyl oligopeptidase family serine peptidase [Aquimarina aggregata]